MTTTSAATRGRNQRHAPRGADLLAVPSKLRAIAAHQAGVVTRRQLGSAGFTVTHVEGALDARRWRAFGRQVIALQNAPLTAQQRNWVAVLLIGKPAALAGLSGAAAAGLRGFEPDKVHLVVAHDSQVRAPGWIKLHESRRFTPDDISLSASPPRTFAPRSIIDAATWSVPPRRACAILCAAVQQRLVTAGQLMDELNCAGRIRHVAIMRAILGDISGGGHTLTEIELGRLARRAGLDPPRRQVLRREPNGRARYLDAEFDLPDGSVLAVEVDGAAHLQPLTWWDDLDRQNEVVLGGTPVLRFPSVVVRLDEARVVDQLTRMRIRHASANAPH